MSRILCTHPGRHGDAIWAMCTARALAEQSGAPVDLILPGQYGGLAPLLRQQPYLDLVFVDDSWVVQQSAPITPREPRPPAGGWRYDAVHHLGYESWPSPDVARDPARRCGVEVDLTRPWITPTAPYAYAMVGVTVGFTDEWFELKYGIFELLTKHPTIYAGTGIGNWLSVSAVEGSRWWKEARHRAGGWAEIAQEIKNSRCFLGCCSALHVLAVAMGVPVVILEPHADRHNGIFYPLGKVGPEVTLVLGNDGLPTIDARHCWDAVRAVLERSKG